MPKKKKKKTTLAAKGKIGPHLTSLTFPGFCLQLLFFYLDVAANMTCLEKDTFAL